MGTGRIPTRRQLKVWLRQHSGVEPVSLRQYLGATEERIGWELGFAQLFIHDRLGGDTGVLKGTLRAAAREVARRGGVLGDWWWTERSTAVEATLVLTDGSLARLILLKEKTMFDLEAFVWSYSRCPQEHRNGEVVPMFYGSTVFNEVYFDLKEGVVLEGLKEVADPSGWWELIPVSEIEGFSYRSCTGSVVEAQRDPSGKWEVIRTENVGPNTFERLRAAGYDGPVNRRP